MWMTYHPDQQDQAQHTAPYEDFCMVSNSKKRVVLPSLCYMCAGLQKKQLNIYSALARLPKIYTLWFASQRFYLS